jgi:hypothetical protein
MAKTEIAGHMRFALGAPYQERGKALRAGIPPLFKVVTNSKKIRPTRALISAAWSIPSADGSTIIAPQWMALACTEIAGDPTAVRR